MGLTVVKFLLKMFYLEQNNYKKYPPTQK